MSLLQSTSLLTSGVKSLKTGALPDLSSTVTALSSAGVLTKNEATVVKAGLSIANSIESGHVPSLNTVTSSLSAVGILSKTEAKTLDKSINIAISSSANNIASDANKLLATLTKSGVIDPATSNL